MIYYYPYGYIMDDVIAFKRQICRKKIPLLSEGDFAIRLSDFRVAISFYFLGGIF